jgi:pimeloyl-ACP methyl ester carboxylesterase
MPILIVTGANTIAIHRLVNEELARLLPHAQRAEIPDTGHGSPRENPEAFNGAVLQFLGGSGDEVTRPDTEAVAPSRLPRPGRRSA